MNNRICTEIFLAVLLVLSCGQGLAMDGKGGLARLDCPGLYRLATQLEGQAQYRQSIVFNDKSRLIATTIGTVVSVGYYWLGAELAYSYYEDFAKLNRRRQLDLVRGQLARQYCFQKF